jgi:type VI secretion system protein VasG
MEIDIRTLLAKLNAECKRAMTVAAELCVKQTHFSVDLEHFLLQLFEGPTPDISRILERFAIDPAVVSGQLQQSLERFKRGNGRTPALSPHFVSLLQEAWLLSSMLLGQQQVRSGTVVLALLEVDSLRGALLESAPALLEIPRGPLRTELAGLLSMSSEDTAGGVAAAPGAAPAAAVGQMPEARPANNSGTPSLDQFTIDITAQAKSGKIDPIRGRDDEIRQIVDILLRRRQNNPILTGEAGVGKTAVVEGFAQRVVQGRVPPALREVTVRSLDLGLLQAGAGIKGEFENRLK